MIENKQNINYYTSKTSMLILSSKPDTIKEYLLKIWQNKQLIVTLAKRDLKIKYAQTALGLSWTMLQPLTAAIVFTLFFSVLLDLDDMIAYPYVLFVLSGVIMWNLFNFIFTHGSSSLSANTDLILKMNFPKIILPFSKIIQGLIEFGATIVLLFLLMIYFGAGINLKILLIPVVIIPAVLLATGLALMLSASSIKNRDLFHVVPFLINFGIWFTPVFYPVTLLPDQYAQYLYLNPMATVIQMFRWCFFGDPLNMYMLLGVCFSFIIFIVGFAMFKKIDDKIIDIL